MDDIIGYYVIIDCGDGSARLDLYETFDFAEQARIEEQDKYGMDVLTDGEVRTLLRSYIQTQNKEEYGSTA